MKGIIKSRFALLVGLGLVWLAFGVWSYSFYHIYYNESIVADQRSSIEEVWKAEGALQ